MSPWLLALIGGGAEPKTKTFLANETWPAPAGVTFLLSAEGKGAPGGSASSRSVYDRTTNTFYQRRDDGSLDTVFNGTTFGIPGTAPAPFCDPVVTTPDDPTYVGHRTCYEFTNRQVATPPTTGASTTGFGKTFPGGTGGPATLTAYTNVPVAASNDIVVPAGGSLTISYYQ